MRFSAALLVGVFAAYANAAATTTSSSSVAESSAEAAVVKCLNACDPSDVNCRAKCTPVPDPSSQDANDTNKCVSECPQGKGTASDNLNYATCVQSCINEHYFTTSGTPKATGGSGSGRGGSAASASATAAASATGTGAAKPGKATGSAGGDSPSGTASGSPSGTASGSSSSSTAKSAANGLRVMSSAVGVLAFAAALFAL